MTSINAFSARPNVRGRAELFLVSQDIPGNFSTVGIQLWAEETVQQASFSTTVDKPWVDYSFNGLWGFDFRPTGLQAYLLLNTSFTFAHNSDGTGSVGASWAIQGDILGSAGSGEVLNLPRIPRGPRIKNAGVYQNSIAYIKNAAAYQVAIPYVKNAGVYQIGGS